MTSEAVRRGGCGARRVSGACAFRPLLSCFCFCCRHSLSRSGPFGRTLWRLTAVCQGRLGLAEVEGDLWWGTVEWVVQRSLRGLPLA